MNIIRGRPDNRRVENQRIWTRLLLVAGLKAPGSSQKCVTSFLSFETQLKFQTHTENWLPMFSTEVARCSIWCRTCAYQWLEIDLPSFDLSKWESERALDWLLLVNAVAGMAYTRDRSTRPSCPLHFLFINKATKRTQNFRKNGNGTQVPLPSSQGWRQRTRTKIHRLSTNVFLWGINIFRLLSKSAAAIYPCQMTSLFLVKCSRMWIVFLIVLFYTISRMTLTL